MNIILTGMKHCGKSTQGRLLAEKLGRSFIDTDDAVEAAWLESRGSRCSCREIYRSEGGEFFRRLEAAAVAGLLEKADASGEAVYSFGGGTVANAFLPPGWRKLGKVIYLKASPLVIYSRIEGGGLPPYLAQAADPFAEFLRITAERETGFIANSDLIFELDMQLPARENHEKLLDFLREKELM